MNVGDVLWYFWVGHTFTNIYKYIPISEIKYKITSEQLDEWKNNKITQR